MFRENEEARNWDYGTRTLLRIYNTVHAHVHVFIYPDHLATLDVLRSVSKISKIISRYFEMYIHPDIITEDQVSYRPKTPLEWAEQALLQANSQTTKAIAEMELLRGVELRPGRNQINLFQPRTAKLPWHIVADK